MSVKMLKDAVGNREKKEKKKLNAKFIFEIILMICIIVTSVNIIYWLVPTFLSIVFLLMQIRTIVNYITEKKK